MRIDENNFIIIKLFKNGSLQMSGCKSLTDVNIAIYKLITRLGERKIIDSDNIIQFVEKIEDFRLIKFKIHFINSDFGVNYLINKANLHQILTEQNILSRPSASHACVNIKYKISNNTYISIFVFQTGSIIITGAKTAENIREAYIFIVRFLNKHKLKIIKKDISKILTIEEITEILKETLK
jgi:TATA-box binding protein (TBP) (component of TFIID and TFIIIB)